MAAGYETRFLMGNDEHSLNVRRQAEQQELDPLDYCAKMEDVFRAVWAKLDISFDDFIRTTEDRHRLGVQKLLEAIRARGGIYEGTYEGWYCVSCEAFKQEKDLEDGNCPLHKAKPDWISEKNHFFRLSDYRDRLLDLYRERPSFIEPETRRNELTNVLEAGLLDLSVSRPGSGWGIPVPFDERSVVYVWFDALMNYLSATGYGTGEEGWDERWPADLHIVGKDITRFHAVIWPAMLMAAGVAIPRQVFGHGFVNFQGEKMSKSLGTAVDPLEAADHFGADPLRLFLVREIQYGQDGDFSWDRFEARYDADLANALGNLVSRITSMAAPLPGGPAGSLGPLDLAGDLDAGSSRLPHRHGGPPAPRRGGRRLPDHRGGQRVPDRARTLEAGEGSGRRSRARRSALRSCRSDADRGGVAPPRDAAVHGPRPRTAGRPERRSDPVR